LLPARFTPITVLGKLTASFYLTLEGEGIKRLDPLVNIFFVFHDAVERL